MDEVQLDAPPPAEGGSVEYINGDPPLLEDLDIDIVKIKYKFIAILT